MPTLIRGLFRGVYWGVPFEAEECNHNYSQEDLLRIV